MEVSSLKPDDVRVEYLRDNTTLVLGAPYIGKTTRFDDLDITVTERIPDTEDVSTAKPIVIDDFYEAYQAANDSRRLAFRELLTRWEGICLSTRPRNLDWLLERDDVFTSDILDAFDNIILLRYDLESDEGDALDRCVNIGTDTGARDESGGIDRAAIADNVEKITYDGYGFDNDRLKSLIGVYEPTIVPALVAYLSGNLEKGRLTLSRSGVRAACSDLASKITFTEGYSQLRETVGSAWDAVESGDILDMDLMTSLASRLGSSDATEAVGTSLSVSLLWSAPAVGAVLLLVSSGIGALGDDGTGERLLNRIVRDELTPAAKEELEKQLDLPPLTIDRLSRLTEGEAQRTIAALSEFDATELRALRAELDERGAEHDQLKTTVEELAERAERAEAYSAFFSRHLRTAARDVDWLGDRIVDEERTLLREVVDESFGVEDIEYYETDENGDRDDKSGRITRAVAAEVGRVVVLQGPHGTGKTTAAYRALKGLPDAYAARVPNLRDHSIGFVEQQLRNHVDADEVVLYVSYTPAQSGWVSDRSQLATLFEWVNNGLCAAVLVECRSEQYQAFKETASNAAAAVDGGGQLWDDRTPVVFEPFERTDNTRRLVEWVADQANWDGDVATAVNAVEDIARGNPEITKLAARFAVDDDRSLVEVKTADGLVRKDLRHFFDADGGAEGRQWRVFTRLAVAGELTTAQLQEVTGLNRTELGECGQRLAGYLSERVTEAVTGSGGRGLSSGRSRLDDNVPWRVSPDIYGDVVFRYCLDNEPDKADTFDVAFGELFDPDNEYSYDDVPPAIGMNLATAYQNAELKLERGREGGGPDLVAFKRTVLEKSDEFLWELFGVPWTPGTLAASIRNLSFGRVPIDPELLAEHPEQVVNDAQVESLRFDTDAEAVVGNFLSYLAVAHLESDGTDLSDLEGVERVFRAQFENQAQFLENIYSLVFLHLADKYPEPAAVEAWLDDIDRRAAAIAIDGNVHDEPADRFLANVYSMAFSNLADRYPKPAAAEAWLDDIDRRAAAIAIDGNVHDEPAGGFLENVYSMVFLHLSDKHPEPAAVEAWLDDIDRRAAAIARNDSADWFLENVYSMAFSNLAGRYQEPAVVEAWLDDIDRRATRAARAANENAHNEPVGPFLENVYSMVFSNLADKHPEPAAVEAWLDDIDRRTIATAADENTHDLSSSTFLENVYSMVFSNLADKHPEPAAVEAWLDDIDSRAMAIAIDGNVHDEPANLFLANIYSMVFSNLADEYPEPAAVEAWLDDIDRRAARTADRDIHEWNRPEFLGFYFASSLAQTVPDSGSIALALWPRTVLSRATASLDHNALAHFYDRVQRSAESPEIAIFILSDLLEGVTNDDPSYDACDGQITVVAIAAARTIQMFYDFGIPLDHNLFQQVFSSLSALAIADHGLFADVVTHAAELLDGQPCSVDLRPLSVESTAARNAVVEHALAHVLSRTTGDTGTSALLDLLDTLVTLGGLTDDPAAMYTDCLTRAAGLDHATPEGAASLVAGVANHLAHADDPPFDCAARTEALASAIAAVLARTPNDFDPGPPFDEVVATVEALSDVDPHLCEQVTEMVADNLESSTHGFDFLTATAWREALDEG